MSPQGPQHAATIRRLNQILVEKFGSTHAVAPRCSLDLGEYSQPEPDFALIRHEDDPGASALPQKADLVIEVSVSSVSYDRTEKCSLYAKAGVLEVWIVHPEGGWIEVYREPVPDPGAVFGFGYGSKRTVRRSEFVSPSWAPDALIGVDGVV